MATYRYTAKSVDGKSETGTTQATSTHELTQELASKGLILITANVETGKSKGRFLFSLRRRISLADKLMITRNLQIMVSTGLSLVKSFSLLSEQAKNKEVRNALLDIKEEISKGESLANSLAKYPEFFSEIFRNMVAVGEASGTLEDIMKILSLQIEKDYQLSSKIKRALIYPSILLTVMLGVGAVVMTVFVPGLKSLFSGLNVQLPIYTKIVIAIGDFMLNYWYYVILILAFSVAIIIKFLQTKEGKLIRDAILIRLPFFSKLVKKANSASCVRSLSSLISAGVPLVESLEITSRTLSNGYFERALIDTASRVRKGEMLSASLALYKDLFPFGTVETIKVGEETGETPTILKKLADFYEQEVMDATDNISVLIEPILIIILGVAVGIFAFAVLSPLYSVLSVIQ